MSDILNSLKKYVDSGQYFADSRTWYLQKYTSPISHRALLAICSVVAICMMCLIALNIELILPLSKQLKYATFLNNQSNAQKAAKVTKADGVRNDSLLSIVKILVEGYVNAYESYEYSNMDNQKLYLKNASTRLVFKNFEDYMSTDNVNSPVLRYQKDGQRDIKINSIKFINQNEAHVSFNSIGKDATNQIFENIDWVATVAFESDPIRLGIPSDSPFHFIVTDYKVKIVQNNIP